MEKRLRTIVRLSRPVLFKNDNDRYRLAYGFVLDENRVGDYDDRDIFAYVGYLAGMHFFVAGADYFDVSHEYGALWVDKKGTPHLIEDSWMEQMAEKCRNLLGLTYEIIKMEIDDETLVSVSESDFLITSESLFDEQEKQGDELTS